jgi:hypothetical protein
MRRGPNILVPEMVGGMALPLGRILFGRPPEHFTELHPMADAPNDAMYRASPQGDPIYAQGIQQLILTPTPLNARRRQGKSS